MKPIIYIDRTTGEKEQEKVYGAAALKLAYGDDLLSKLFGTPLLHIASRWALFSQLYGAWQKSPLSKRKVLPFIEKYGVDTSEFLIPPEQFSSFNDFFIRQLKPDARPISNTAAIIPADGRYWFYQNISDADGFIVKGKKFDLHTLLKDDNLALEYAGGSMIMARLCPTDYHRFHFPCDCTPGPTRLINGPLYSVNPIAIQKNIEIFTQNKRTLTTLTTKTFGDVLFLEIGATNVGSIHQTYTPGKEHSKGDEKGYFSFGGSALIILFKPNTITFCSDLVEATETGHEMRCLMGQPLAET